MKFFSKGDQMLRRDIVVTLLVKLGLLYGLWWLFFSSPVDEKLDKQAIAERLFDSPSLEDVSGFTSNNNGAQP